MDTGGPAYPRCKWCDSASYVKQGRIYLCPKHYRLQQMRSSARRYGKSVPSYSELESLIPDNFLCGPCQRTMNWLGKDGQSTVITLQHDRDGGHRMICRACNTRHAKCNEDSFYSLPTGKKRCPRCRCFKSLDNFSTDNNRRWMNKKTYCRSCATAIHATWASRNREYVNGKQRENRAKRKVAAAEKRATEK